MMNQKSNFIRNFRIPVISAILLVCCIAAGCADRNQLTEQEITTTPSPTLAASWTPEVESAPTRTHEEATEWLDRLMVTNGGCELPCIWGIEPGLNGEDVREFLSNLSFSSIDFQKDGGLLQSFVFIDTQSRGKYFNFSLYIQDDAAKAILIRPDESGSPLGEVYSLKHVLVARGLPTNILLYTGTDYQSIYLIAYYAQPENWMILRYEFLVEMGDDQTAEFCLNGVSTDESQLMYGRYPSGMLKDAILQDSQAPLTIQELSTIFQIVEYPYFDFNAPLSSSFFKMTKEEFYNRVLLEENPCFQFSIPG